MSKSRSRPSGRLGPLGVTLAAAAGLTLVGALHDHDHVPAAVAPTPTPQPAPVGSDTPWGLFVLVAVVIVLAVTVGVAAVWRVRRPVVTRRWTRPEVVEAATPQPALEARTWHYILKGRTGGSGWVELGRGYVDWPAADRHEMEAEVVRRALERKPDGVFRAWATPAVRQETPR